RNRISQAKGAAHKLLRHSYVKRDRVAIVGFRGTRAQVLLPPSKSMLRASRVLDSLAVGGGTPLSAGLRCSLEVAKRVRSDGAQVVLLLFTDGQANVAVRANGNGSRSPRHVIEKEIASLGLELRRLGVQTVVVDTQNEFVASHNARFLAEQLSGTYQRLRNY
ncbi:MAG TPA: VWA domain-containing protein, partial [Pyrinomonadaceae bacterium]|nr:VWA domain-containing protein [Pyrinomonadaceae bacterium]